jgi:hypothetical protein
MYVHLETFNFFYKIGINEKHVLNIRFKFIGQVFLVFNTY